MFKRKHVDDDVVSFQEKRSKLVQSLALPLHIMVNILRYLHFVDRFYVMTLLAEEHPTLAEDDHGLFEKIVVSPITEMGFCYNSRTNGIIHNPPCISYYNHLRTSWEQLLPQYPCLRYVQELVFRDVGKNVPEAWLRVDLPKLRIIKFRMKEVLCSSTKLLPLFARFGQTLQSIDSGYGKTLIDHKNCHKIRGGTYISQGERWYQFMTSDITPKVFPQLRYIRTAASLYIYDNPAMRNQLRLRRDVIVNNESHNIHEWDSTIVDEAVIYPRVLKNIDDLDSRRTLMVFPLVKRLVIYSTIAETETFILSWDTCFPNITTLKLDIYDMESCNPKFWQLLQFLINHFRLLEEISIKVRNFQRVNLHSDWMIKTTGLTRALSSVKIKLMEYGNQQMKKYVETPLRDAGVDLIVEKSRHGTHPKWIKYQLYSCC